MIHAMFSSQRWGETPVECRNARAKSDASRLRGISSLKLSLGRCNASVSEAWQYGPSAPFASFPNQRLLPLDANRFCQVVPQIGTMLLTYPAARNTRIYSGQS